MVIDSQIFKSKNRDMDVYTLVKKAKKQMKKVSAISGRKVFKHDIRTRCMLQHASFLLHIHTKIFRYFLLFSVVFRFAPFRIHLHRIGKPESPRA
jgi:hypothetical protein